MFSNTAFGLLVILLGAVDENTQQFMGQIQMQVETSNGPSIIITAADDKGFTDSRQYVINDSIKIVDEDGQDVKERMKSPLLGEDKVVVATLEKRDGEYTLTKLECRGWFRAVTSAAGKFSCKMPGKPVEKDSDRESGFGKVTEHTYACAVSANELYEVIYSDLPAELVAGRDAKEVLKAFQAGSRKGNQIISEKEVALGENQVPGRDYVAQAGAYFIHERVYLADQRLYRLIIVSTSRTAVDGAYSGVFLRSLKIDR